MTKFVRITSPSTEYGNGLVPLHRGWFVVVDSSLYAPLGGVTTKC